VSSKFNEIDILKIDCEGAEFDFFSNASSDDLGRIQQVVGEFHRAQGTPEELAGYLARGGLEFQMISDDGRTGQFLATRRGA
ncbi:MAG: FkbM family methyltransferase, partial [Sulfobacillus sp.]